VALRVFPSVARVMTLGTLAAAIAVDSRAIDSFGFQSPFVSCLSPAKFRASYACCSIVVKPGNREGYGGIDNQQCRLFYEHTALMAADRFSTAQQITPPERNHASRLINHIGSARLCEELPAGPHDATAEQMGSYFRGDVAALELRSRELRFRNLRFGSHVECHFDGNAPERLADQQRSFVKEPAAVKTRLGSHVECHFDGNAPERLADQQRSFVKEPAAVKTRLGSHVEMIFDGNATKRFADQQRRFVKESAAVTIRPCSRVEFHFDGRLFGTCIAAMATFGLASDRPEVEKLRLTRALAPTELHGGRSGPGETLDSMVAGRVQKGTALLRRASENCSTAEIMFGLASNRLEVETLRFNCTHTPANHAPCITLHGCRSDSGGTALLKRKFDDHMSSFQGVRFTLVGASAHRMCQPVLSAHACTLVWDLGLHGPT
jgi:hypothetical protein